jgi:hypothetical protein
MHGARGAPCCAEKPQSFQAHALAMTGSFWHVRARFRSDALWSGRVKFLKTRTKSEAPPWFWHS